MFGTWTSWKAIMVGRNLRRPDMEKEEKKTLQEVLEALYLLFVALVTIEY